MIKCACGDKDCPINLYVSGKELWFVGKTGETTLMYLSLDTMLELRLELKNAICHIVNEET